MMIDKLSLLIKKNFLWFSQRKDFPIPMQLLQKLIKIYSFSSSLLKNLMFFFFENPENKFKFKIFCYFSLKPPKICNKT